MPRRRGRRWLLGIAVGLVVLPLALVLAHPRARAVLRLTRGFVPHTEDARVRYEPGAQAWADRIVAALPGAVARVERCHGRPFRSSFRVYVCATHESFTRHIAHPVDSPVRGIAFLWDIWVSPKAFAFAGQDTHRQTLAHELSHLFLQQHLGWWRRSRNVPPWFAEGLADWVADTGGERVSRQEALGAILRGRQLVPDASGRVPFPRTLRDYGLPPPMLHMQSRMFVEHLRARDEQAFGALVAAVVAGERFDAAMREHFEDSVEEAWRGFVDSLRAAESQGPGGPAEGET